MIFGIFGQIVKTNPQPPSREHSAARAVTAAAAAAAAAEAAVAVAAAAGMAVGVDYLWLQVQGAAIRYICWSCQNLLSGY